MPSADQNTDADRSKYNVKIEHGQGVVVGDHARVEQHFHNTSQESQKNLSDRLLKQGVQLLKGQSYQQAIDVLNSALNADTNMYDVYFYLSIALLRGRRP